MVQRQAQVTEVRLARLQADLASAQSRSVMIFTVSSISAKSSKICVLICNGDRCSLSYLYDAVPTQPHCH